MKKRNILVFPCGSEIGLDIYSSVRYSTYFHLIGANSIEDHGSFVYDDYVGNIPFITDEHFLPTIKKLVRERHIDAIYPAMDSVITVLKQHEDELGCLVVTSSVETTEICLSKRKTYEVLRDTVCVPRLLNPATVDCYPVFVKPDVGYGSRGAQRIDDAAHLADVLSSRADLLVLEYLPGEEYTVDCFTDRKGRLLYSGARVRKRIRNGISVNTSFVEDQTEFTALAEKLNEKIKFRGAWFYQVKRKADGTLCLMEMASRLGGSSLLSRAVGINMALMALFDTFGYDVAAQQNNYRVTLDRALSNRYKCDGLSYSTVYVDYDDCLILDKTQVNVQLVAFLYQCINERKRIVLLTKHAGNLTEELKRFRLDTLFDEVRHIGEEEQKTAFVDTADAIFIDDSFAERDRILRTKGIPVFSPEMIDVLSR